MRPTPETDAVAEAVGMGHFMVDAEFARRLERERDEAREEAGHWKTEYEIVVDRLRGRKHPRDNGIIADDEIIPKLERERDEAREASDKWKKLHDIKDELFKKGIAEVERERDEAREALRTLAEHGESEIQRLTKERDEAREQAAKWLARLQEHGLEEYGN